MRNIDKFSPPYEPVIVWRGGFTPEECEHIIKAGELAEFQKGSIGGPKNVDLNVRDTDITWIEPLEENKWMFERLHDILLQVNHDKYQMDFSRFDGFQYSKYNVDGHYDWHVDVENKPRPGGLFRKLSISIMLTDNDNYKGGALLINENGGENKRATKLQPKIGDIVFFYSYLPHKVEKVTSGERITLVTWALGEKYK